MKNLFKTELHSTKVDLALTGMRLIMGTAMAMHGWGKIQNPMSWMGPDVPGILQFLAALSEFGGGIAWALGLLTPLASFGIACTMVVAVYVHAVVKGDPFVGHNGSYELASIYLIFAVLLIAMGPGKFSLDSKVFGKKN